MKRYLIPAIVVVLVGVGTYFWTSHVSARHALLKAKRAHLDSLRSIQTVRLNVLAKPIDPHIADSISLDSEDKAITRDLGTLWDAKHLDAMPDSIRPQEFSERSVVYSYDEAVEYEDTVGALDTVGIQTEERTHAFVSYTVMAMLTRHLKGSVETDEFSRCPSGYNFVTNNIYGTAAHSAPEWDSGTVYFGAGCNDTALCDFRINYAKRLVEMKDINTSRFMSLRQYEMLKFGQYADLRKKE
jgi:hypothetical protein